MAKPGVTGAAAGTGGSGVAKQILQNKTTKRSDKCFKLFFISMQK